MRRDAGTAVDTSLMGVAQIGVAVPNFWFAILFVLLFSTSLQWFSAGGFPGWDAGFFECMKSIDPAGYIVGAYRRRQYCRG